MGIYTEAYASYDHSDYTSVEPFIGESFNYHELGIIAAHEINTNYNSFMKSIALSELAALEQTGSTDVFYESVDIKGIFAKIKAFFQKVLEKIRKIFHTFIAKMKSWFGDTKKFAEKYGKEIKNKWNDVKSDWEFKGYNFSVVGGVKIDTDIKADAKTNSNALKQLMATSDFAGLANNGYATIKNDSEYFDASGKKSQNNDWSDVKTTKQKTAGSGATTYDTPTSEKTYKDLKAAISSINENYEDCVDHMRQQAIASITGTDHKLLLKFEVSSSGDGLDAKEFSKELFKAFRNDEDSKKNITKSEIETMYGGSINSLVEFIKNFDKTLKDVKEAQKKIDDSYKKLISKIESQASKLKSDDTGTNDNLTYCAGFYQKVYSSISSIVTEEFAAYISALKEKCTQAKEICVKTISLSKKMTESYDYSDSYSDNGGFDFISSVKLV